MTRRTVALGIAVALALWGAALFAAFRLGRVLVEPSAASPAGARPGRPDPGAPRASTLSEGGRTPAETAAVARASRTGLVPATDDDAEPTPERDELADLYGDYHPYFVRGDLDGDGRLDFVQAFVKKRDGGVFFDVAVFFGREDGTFSEPVFALRAVPIASGDLSLDRTVLVVTPDLAADETQRYRWEPSEGRFVDVDAESKSGPPVDDAPEPTPDQRPRARV